MRPGAYIARSLFQSMVVIYMESDLDAFIDKHRSAGFNIGFVPTMGALHQGHMSLISKSKARNDVTVCSIFVNPTQFNDPEDYRSYPSSLNEDIALLRGAACDALFLPSIATVYPNGTDAMATFDFGALEATLEGSFRPGHFKGVGQVVNRLLDLVKPDTLYLGQKDFQQCMVVRRLLQMSGKAHIRLVVCPTYRESDGLAMSSRNRRLTEPQRVIAAVIYQCLVSIAAKSALTSFEIVSKECIDLLSGKGFRPEYVALVDAEHFQMLTDYDPTRETVALIAAWLGDVRLIDNIVLRPEMV